jgi:homoserine O-acetyltransferase
MSYTRFVSSETKTFRLPGAFDLEGGERLEGVEVAYRSWGSLSLEADNAVLVCHALSGSADVDGWWSGVVGPGRGLDPEHDYVVAANVLGGCYGTTGPSTPAPGFPNGRGPEFPDVTIRDQVRLQAALLRGLGVRRLRLVVGGSMGGMQALEWGVTEPLPVDAVAALGAPARHSPWAIGLAETQRKAIETDLAWKGGRYDSGAPPKSGLAAARMLAMCSYRSPGSFRRRFRRERAATGAFQVESYLRYQGEKLADRFDANSYLVITRAMDTHDLARGRGSLEGILQGIRPKVLLVGIPSDVLYTPEEVEELAEGIPGSELAWIESPHGHDAFLMELDEVSEILRAFRARAGLSVSLVSEEGRVERCA